MNRMPKIPCSRRAFDDVKAEESFLRLSAVAAGLRSASDTASCNRCQGLLTSERFNFEKGETQGGGTALQIVAI